MLLEGTENLRQLTPHAGAVLPELTERALRYGLSMVRKAGGGLRPHVQPSNSYEKRLLPEVVHPDDAGIGFSEASSQCLPPPCHPLLWAMCIPKILACHSAAASCRCGHRRAMGSPWPQARHLHSWQGDTAQRDSRCLQAGGRAGQGEDGAEGGGAAAAAAAGPVCQGQPGSPHQGHPALRPSRRGLRPSVPGMHSTHRQHYPALLNPKVHTALPEIRHARQKSLALVTIAGTGKTLLAKATAAECGASFLAIAPSTVTSKWVGESVRIVRACFSLAAKLAPCVLFLDEVVPSPTICILLVL